MHIHEDWRCDAILILILIIYNIFTQAEQGGVRLPHREKNEIKITREGGCTRCRNTEEAEDGPNISDALPRSQTILFSFITRRAPGSRISIPFSDAFQECNLAISSAVWPFGAGGGTGSGRDRPFPHFLLREHRSVHVCTYA